MYIPPVPGRYRPSTRVPNSNCAFDDFTRASSRFSALARCEKGSAGPQHKPRNSRSCLQLVSRRWHGSKRLPTTCRAVRDALPAAAALMVEPPKLQRRSGRLRQFRTGAAGPHCLPFLCSPSKQCSMGSAAMHFMLAALLAIAASTGDGIASSRGAAVGVLLVHCSISWMHWIPRVPTCLSCIQPPRAATASAGIEHHQTQLPLLLAGNKRLVLWSPSRVPHGGMCWGRSRCMQRDGIPKLD